jgi:hypothetical protein
VYAPNFCIECGAPIARRRSRIRWGPLCEHCAPRFIRQRVNRIAAVIIVLVITGVAIGHYFRPSPPPLVIERSANSPLSDLPIDVNDKQTASSPYGTAESDSSATTRVAVRSDEAIYICGARTQKGTPCRRRVHAAGERCYQHKGRPAMVPIEKLLVKDV